MKEAQKADKPSDELLTYGMAAERCNVDEAFIRKAIANKELRVIILGPKTHRISLIELRRWWKTKETKAVILPT